MEILRVENLTSKQYGKGENKVTALDNVSFKMKKERICWQWWEHLEVENQHYYI